MTTPDPLDLLGDFDIGPDAHGTTTVWDNRNPDQPVPLTEPQLVALVDHALALRRMLELFRSDVNDAVEALEDDTRDTQLTLENLTFAARCLLGVYDPSTWPAPIEEETTR